MFEFKPHHAIEFDYVNWEGVTGHRKVRTQRILFGITDHHPEPQWLLEAFDFDKGAIRIFAMKDMYDVQYGTKNTAE